jgi:SAM-dependent methyltransferase
MSDRPWQLEMFDRSLKKRLKLRLIQKQLGPASGLRCLLVTNGDNTGALNWHLRAGGGDWVFVENEPENVAEMSAFLGQPVERGEATRVPAADDSFDAVITIDVHEHLSDCRPFNRELARVTRPGGRVIVTTPNGGDRRPVTLVKRLIGMTNERYGHVVTGYTIAEHRAMLRDAGLEPVDAGSYSKFFTESIELAINAAYVIVLPKIKGRTARSGTIAPTSSGEMAATGAAYRVYSAVFPLLRAVSALDAILPTRVGYAVSVVARKPA